MFSFFGGGHGGHPNGDGLNHGNAPISTATIPPLEILEAAYPVKFTQWALRPDSGGAGRHRGGLGAVYEIELLEAEATAFLFGDRGKFAPRGVVGGGDAAMTRFTFPKDGAPTNPPLASKIVDVLLRRGDRVRLETPGGGGYGDPAERDPKAIRRDLELGFVSPDAARRDYGRAGQP
jgi:N-methylhydantoinase B